MLVELETGSLSEPISGRHWDRREVARQVARRVRFYARQGMAPGDRVFVHYGNRLEFFADLLAVWRLGGAVVPLDPGLTPFEAETLAGAARPRFSIVDDTTDRGPLGRSAAGAAMVVNTLDVEHSTGVTDGDLPLPRARLDDDALILFTSGSTGAPKGVVHTHRSLRARWLGLRGHLPLAPFRRTLCVLPTHFGHGLICNCLFPWLSGQDLFITPPFRPDIVMRLGALLDEHEITFMSSVPALWRLALRTARPPRKNTLQQVHCGSAPLSADLWRAVQAWTSTLRVLNAYGITETGSWVAGTTLESFSPEDGLVGEPWGAVIRVLGPHGPDALAESDGACEPGESGQVWISTPALMRGYLDRDDLTDQVMRGGWFLTGDIGVIDEQGRLYLRGRERDEINKGGLKVFPADVDAVAERFDRVIDVCTFGIDDPLYGQNVGIAVVLARQDAATIRELYQWMRRHLAEPKLPVRWYLLDAIPRTSRGKVDREGVRERCARTTPLALRQIVPGGPGAD